MILLSGVAFAADMAWRCLSFTTALEAVEYRDASVDGGLTDAYDTLYALIDANCEVTACDPDCEEIVDCTTEAGDLINWMSETTNESDTLSTWERIEVIPAASSGYGWTRAQADYETSYMSISYWVASANRSFEYDGDWADGWPTDGVLAWSTYDYNAEEQIESWDDGACQWRRSYVNDGGWYAWSVTANGTSLYVEYDGYFGCAAPAGASVELNGVYIGVADAWTWESIPDVDLDGSPAPQDCDDTDPGRSPCLDENPHDSIDNDCDGVADDGDADGDGFLSPESGGEDCDDDVATTHPGAADARGDGVDQDCNGMDQPALPRVRYGSGPLVRP